MDRCASLCAVRASFAFLALMLLPSVRAGAAAEKTPAPEKVVIAYSSLSANMAPLWITHERGFFRKYGLDVQLVFIESGTTTVQSLISNDVAFAQMAGAGVIQSRLRGADVVMIAGVINTLTFKFYVDTSIRQPEQLRGKAVAVTRVGSSTDFAARYALERYGLTPDKDVAIVQAGNMPAILAGMQAGKVQGAMLSAPFTLRAKSMGFPMLADLQMLGLEYQHTGLATTGALIRRRPDLVRNVMRAYVEGIHYYKTNREDSLAILAKYLKTSDAEVLAEVYEDIGLALVPEKPYPTLRGIEIMLRELRAKDPQTKPMRAEEFVNVSALQELDRAGFIDALYKSRPVVARREAPAAPPQPVAKPVTGPAPKAAVKAVVAEGAREYVVMPGDTLSRLAQRYYGDGHKWRLIYEANRPKMSNPDYIYVGQKIVIPAG
ncbi:MAG TPA: ABC transporter substrate-binding protein [candidate division Zixibacteria bacterium]|nr:ABC transporter substrate-binding protein [candidate division Zixibacteria bacterium]